jgi:hypothetical protein
MQFDQVRAELASACLIFKSGADLSAQQLKERYWLYVVENPGAPFQIIHRIQNPALQVKSFTYDHGWRVLAEAEVST